MDAGLHRKRKRHERATSSITSAVEDVRSGLSPAAQRMRERLALAPSAALRTSAGGSVVARYGLDPLTGWLFEDGDARRLAWLGQFDHRSWVARAFTGDEAWTMTPLGRHHPELAAMDPSGHIVARCQRPMLSAPRVVIATERLRLPKPSFRDPDWRLRGDDGELFARLTVTGKQAGTDTLTIQWQRSVTMPGLLTLFCAYIIVITRATEALRSGGGF